MSLTGSLIEANGVGCFSSISYLRYAVSVHKHALEAVVNADVIQNRDDDLAIALHTLGGEKQTTAISIRLNIFGWAKQAITEK